MDKTDRRQSFCPRLYDIDHDEEGHAPCRHDQLREAVSEYHLRRVATPFVHHGQLDVAQQSEDDEDARQVEVVRLIVADHLWADGVHDVAHQGHGGRDGDGLVDKREVVADGVLPRRLPRLVHPHHVVASLGKREEEHEQEGHEHDPFAQVDARGQSSRQQAQYKAEGDDAHVDNGILLQPHAVGDVEQPVEDDHASRFQAVLRQ